jgi:large subunit ribosomal protein L7A
MLQGFKDKEVVVGTKQVKRAVSSGKAELVLLASDSEDKVIRDLVGLCEASGVEIKYIATMKELGKTCGIDVKAASAALLK